MTEKYEGNDNYGKPRSEYVEKVAAMDDSALYKETKRKIWLSGYANNNPSSDYHWHVDACYDEWQRRDKAEEYDKAYNEVLDGVRG